MFDTLCDLFPVDNDYPNRVQKLTLLKRVLDGTLYNVSSLSFPRGTKLCGRIHSTKEKTPKRQISVMPYRCGR